MILRILNIIRKLSKKHAQITIQIRTFFDGFFVMLSALAIPMGSMNIFSDAIAQDYEYNDEHQIAINRLTNYNFIAAGDWYCNEETKKTINNILGYILNL